MYIVFTTMKTFRQKKYTNRSLLSASWVQTAKWYILSYACIQMSIIDESWWFHSKSSFILGVFSLNTLQRMSVCLPKKFFAPEPVRPESSLPRVHSPMGLECTGSVRSYSMYVLQAYCGLSWVMCDAKNTDGALAKISSYFLNNIHWE